MSIMSVRNAINNSTFRPDNHFENNNNNSYELESKHNHAHTHTHIGTVKAIITGIKSNYYKNYTIWEWRELLVGSCAAAR